MSVPRSATSLTRRGVVPTRSIGPTSHALEWCAATHTGSRAPLRPGGGSPGKRRPPGRAAGLLSSAPVRSPLVRAPAIAFGVALLACDPGAARPDPVAVHPPPTGPPAAPRTAEPTDEGCPAGVPRLPPDVQRGVCFAHSWERGGAAGYGTEPSRRSLAELAALGVGWVSLSPYGYQRGVDADRVRRPTHGAAETDARVRRAVADARDAGLRVMLKPHVWVGHGDWVGRIDPGSDAAWARWWDSYRAFTLHHAHLAQALDVPILAVGTELKSTSVRFADRWRALIRDVRAVYGGELVYAANWDEVVDVPWWDAVDYVGIQFYPPVARSRATTEEAMRARLEGYMDHLERVHRRTGKPILFTEVGYRSRLHPEIHPHAWPEHDGEDEPPPSEAAQARAYRRFLSALEGRDWVAGVYWWKWFSNPASDEEGPDGFSPRGKRAAAVLRTAFGGAPCDAGEGAAP